MIPQYDHVSSPSPLPSQLVFSFLSSFFTYHTRTPFSVLLQYTYEEDMWMRTIGVVLSFVSMLDAAQGTIRNASHSLLRHFLLLSPLPSRYSLIILFTLSSKRSLTVPLPSPSPSLSPLSYISSLNWHG